MLLLDSIQACSRIRELSRPADACCGELMPAQTHSFFEQVPVEKLVEVFVDVPSERIVEKASFLFLSIALFLFMSFALFQLRNHIRAITCFCQSA